MTLEPVWLQRVDIEFFHALLIRDFGGSEGLADEALLESAVARPQQVFACHSQDLCNLAAAYAHGLVENHPFVDGNKRIAFVAASVFLEMNGLLLEAPEEQAVVMVEGLAAGQVGLELFAAWLRKHSAR